MRRRNFIASTVALMSSRALPQPATATRFKPCINQVTTLNAPVEQEFNAYAAAGYRYVELWFPKLMERKMKAADVKAALSKAGLTPVSACAIGGMLWSKHGTLESHLPEFQSNLELAQALAVPSFVVFSYAGGTVTADDRKLAAERLHRVAEIASRYRVKVALEFIARSQLIGCLPSTLALLRAAQHPNAGVCLDTFHFFAGVSKFEDLEPLRPGDIAHVHFHDVPASVPREQLQDTDRIPPGEGVIPLDKITVALRRIGYDGYLSTELFGESFQKADPRIVAARCFKAVQRYV